MQLKNGVWGAGRAGYIRSWPGLVRASAADGVLHRIYAVNYILRHLLLRELSLVFLTRARRGRERTPQWRAPDLFQHRSYWNTIPRMQLRPVGVNLVILVPIQ